MKLIFFAVLLCCMQASAQFTAQNDLSREELHLSRPLLIQKNLFSGGPHKDLQAHAADGWKLNRNRILTGGLIMLAGMAKGLNETLEFNWHGFAAVFPKANPRWFWPQQSFKNKYKDNDPAKGPKFPLSTSVLVFVTDQYHLDNFIHHGAITAALVLKIGDGKKPWKQYLWDALYYSATYQLGFGSLYYYFKSRVPK